MSYNTVASITINFHTYASAIQVQTKSLCKSIFPFFPEKKVLYESICKTYTWTLCILKLTIAFISTLCLAFLYKALYIQYVWINLSWNVVIAQYVVTYIVFSLEYMSKQNVCSLAVYWYNTKRFLMCSEMQYIILTSRKNTTGHEQIVNKVLTWTEIRSFFLRQ